MPVTNLLISKKYATEQCWRMLAVTDRPMLIIGFQKRGFVSRHGSRLNSAGQISKPLILLFFDHRTCLSKGHSNLFHGDHAASIPVLHRQAD